ncbi:T3SS effector OspC family protein [Pantoea cypripedii]|uniref:T3SS effector OspC family protein n=1 Tax=Pantoea cypripedii TaxID=55209 RepID=UPI002FC6A8E3
MMQLTTLPINIQQSGCDGVQPENDTGRNRSNLVLSCVSVHNSPETLAQKNVSRDKYSDVIKDFFRKTIAAQSYSKMFSNGANFKELGVDLPELSTRKSSLKSLQHLNALSKHYLTKIKGKVGNLTSQEKDLLSKVVDAKLHFRHQSNSKLAAGALNIMSLHKLQADGVMTAKKTYSEDIRCLSNHDFVFFGVEFSGDKAQLPLNTRHMSVDFGANAYITDDQFPYGYLTLTDHLDNTIPPAFKQEHQSFIAQFSEVRKEIFRRVHGEKGINDVPIYNTKDMRLALGLHLIDFIRNSRDDGFKKFAMNKDLDNHDLDRMLNFVFQPEFHVPRMVSTHNFIEVRLREITMREAVMASNIDVLSECVKSKDEACKAMGFAIKHSKKDVANYLFSKFCFNKEDVIKMSSFDDLEYVLSDSPADENILKVFLERELVNPNKAFTEVNRGGTMLDNAIKFKKQGMIKLLLAYGAKRGDELKKKLNIQE